jgi:AcrR family transcriptional regulator
VKHTEPPRVRLWTKTRAVFAIAHDIAAGGLMAHAGSKDRRVQRTQGLLRGALASLIHEKAYDAIVVKEILARANVGRSTFYAHFRDKDELLVSGINEMLRASETVSAAGPASRHDRILRFSLPVFEHIERHRGAGDARVDAQRQAVVHEHLQRVLAELVAADLEQGGQRRAESGRGMPPDLLAQHVASTFMLVLDWWVERRDPLPATRANELFRALVLPTLTGVLG